MKKIIKFFKAHGGYARMKDLKNAGFHTRNIAEAVEKEIIEKIKPGLYKIINYPWEEFNSFLDVARAKNSAVICLTSALEYHELTTFNPSEITIAVPHHTDKFTMDYPPVKVYYFSKRIYQVGILEVNTKSGPFKIYNAEKTICDIFRYRKKLGEDLALEGLKNYLKRKDADIYKLQKYAKICQVKTVLSPYLKAMVIE